ncbi:MAG: hypothetical protein M0P69_17925, partial [Bacteroidales bacterium]|nr:hypothetical protein [Bacteroidales bacterium]
SVPMPPAAAHSHPSVFGTLPLSAQSAHSFRHLLIQPPNAALQFVSLDTVRLTVFVRHAYADYLSGYLLDRHGLEPLVSSHCRHSS